MTAPLLPSNTTPSRSFHAGSLPTFHEYRREDCKEQVKRALQQLIEQLSDELHLPGANPDIVQRFTEQLKHSESLLAVETTEHLREADIDTLKEEIGHFVSEGDFIDPDRKSLVYPLEVALTWYRPPNSTKDGYFVATQNTQEGKKAIAVKNLSEVIATSSRLHFPEFVVTEHKGRAKKMFDWRDVVVAVNATGNNPAIQFPVQLTIPTKADIEMSISLISEEQRQAPVPADFNQDTLYAAYRPFYAWSVMRGTSARHMLYWNNFFHLREQEELGSLVVLCCQYMNLYQSLHYERQKLEEVSEKVKNHTLTNTYLPNIATVKSSDLHVPIDHILSNLALRSTAILIRDGAYTVAQALTLSTKERGTSEHIEKEAIVRFEQSLINEPWYASYEALLRNTALSDFLAAINFTRQDFKKELSRSSNASSIIQDLNHGSTLHDITCFASSFGGSSSPNPFVKAVFNPSALHKYVKSNTKVVGYHESIRTFLNKKGISLAEDESTQEKIASLSRRIEEFNHILKQNPLAREVLGERASLLGLLEKYKMLTQSLREKLYDEVLQEAQCCCDNARNHVMLHVMKGALQRSIPIQRVLFYPDKARGFWIEWDNEFKSIAQQSSTTSTQSTIQADHLARIPILLTEAGLSNEKLIKEDLIHLSSPIFKGIVTEGVMSFRDIATLPLHIVKSLCRISEAISKDSAIRILSGLSPDRSSDSGMSRIIRNGSNNVMELLSEDKTLQDFKETRKALVEQLKSSAISPSAYNTQLNSAFQPVVERVSFLPQQLAGTRLSSIILALNEAGVPLRKAIQMLPGEEAKPNERITEIINQEVLIEATFKEAGKEAYIVLLNRIYELNPNIKIISLLERAVEIIRFFQEKEIKAYLVQLMPEEVLMLTKEKCDALRKLGKPLVFAGISPSQIITLPERQKAAVQKQLKILTHQFSTVETILRGENIHHCDDLLKKIVEVASTDDTVHEPIALSMRALKVVEYLKSEVIQQYYQAGLITAAHVFRLKEAEYEMLKELSHVLEDDRHKAYFSVIKDTYALSVTSVVENFKAMQSLLERNPFLYAYSCVEEIDTKAFTNSILGSPSFADDSYSEQALSVRWHNLEALEEEDENLAFLARVYASDSKETPFLEHFHSRIEHYLGTMERSTYQRLKVDYTPTKIMHADEETQQKCYRERRPLRQALQTVGLPRERAESCVRSIVSSPEGNATLAEKVSEMREVRQAVESFSPIEKALLKFNKWPLQVILERKESLAELSQDEELRSAVRIHKRRVQEYASAQNAKGRSADRLMQVLVEAVASPAQDITAFKNQLKACMARVEKGYLCLTPLKGLKLETILSLSPEEHDELLRLKEAKQRLETRYERSPKPKYREELDHIRRQLSNLVEKLNSSKASHPNPLPHNRQSTHHAQRSNTTSSHMPPSQAKKTASDRYHTSSGEPRYSLETPSRREERKGGSTSYRSRNHETTAPDFPPAENARNPLADSHGGTFFSTRPAGDRRNNRSRRPRQMVEELSPPSHPSGKGRTGFLGRLFRR